MAHLKTGNLRYYVMTENGASGFPEPLSAKAQFVVTADGQLSIKSQDETKPFLAVPIAQIEPRNESSFDILCTTSNFYVSFSLRDKDDTVASWLGALRAGNLVLDAPTSERKHFRKKDHTKSLKDSSSKKSDSPNGTPRKQKSKASSSDRGSLTDTHATPLADSEKQAEKSVNHHSESNDKAEDDEHSDKKEVDNHADEPQTESSSDDEQSGVPHEEETDVFVEEVPKQQSKLAKMLLKHGASATDFSSKTANLTVSARTVFSLNVKVAEAKGFSRGEKVDSYCAINVDSARRRTRTIAKSDNPLWADEFTVEVQDPTTSVLRVTLWDDKKEDLLYAKSEIPLNDPALSTRKEAWFHMGYGSAAAYTSGELHIRLDRSGERAGIITCSIVEARNLAVVSRADLYVKLCYGKQTHRTKTCSIKSTADKKHAFPVQQDPDWNETFEIIPDADADEYVFSVYRKTNYMQSAVCIGQASLMKMIHLFDDDKYVDRWIVLEPEPEALAKEKAKEKAKEGESRGEIRLALRLHKVVLYPIEYYNNFVNFVMEENGSCLVEILEKTTIGPEARNSVAFTLVRIYEARNQAPVVLKTMISHEVSEAPDVETLFRANSIGSKAIDMYMRLVAFRYLQEVVHETVDELYETKKSVEVDPNRMEKGEDPKKNLKYLMKILNSLLNKLYLSADDCPTSLRTIFQHVQQEVVKKFPGDPVVRYTGVSGFLFLRFICAAILGPKLFDLKADHPAQLALRNLTTIAKIMQRIANMVPTTQQEGELGQVEAFIEEQKIKMQVFLDKICIPDVSLAIFDPAAVDLANELSNLQDSLDKQLDNIIYVMETKSDERLSKNALRLLEILDDMNDKKIEKKRLPVFVKNKSTGDKKLGPTYIEVQKEKEKARIESEEKARKMAELQAQASRDMIEEWESKKRSGPHIVADDPALSDSKEDTPSVRARSKTTVGSKKKKAPVLDDSLSAEDKSAPRKLRRTPSERLPKAQSSLSPRTQVDSDPAKTRRSSLGKEDEVKTRTKRSVSKAELKFSKDNM